MTALRVWHSVPAPGRGQRALRPRPSFMGLLPNIFGLARTPMFPWLASHVHRRQ